MALYPNFLLTALPLDWDEEEFPETVEDIRQSFLRMADVTYNMSSFPMLLRTLASLFALSTSHHDRGDDVGNDAGEDPGGRGQGRDDG